MNTLLWITVCFLFVSGVAPLQCYVCKSIESGEDCSSTEKIKASTEFLRNCSDFPEGQRYTYCRKMFHEIPTLKGGIEVRIVRECGYLNTSINSCKKTGMNVVEQVLCSCDEDGCNFSSQLKPKMIIVVLLMLSTFSTLLL